jgi:hypothetical protein
MQCYGHFATGGIDDRIESTLRAEHGAAVVKQVELHIAATAHQLFLSLRLNVAVHR